MTYEIIKALDSIIPDTFLGRAFTVVLACVVSCTIIGLFALLLTGVWLATIGLGQVA